MAWTFPLKYTNVSLVYCMTLAVSQTKQHKKWRVDLTKLGPTLNKEVLGALASMENFKVWYGQAFQVFIDVFITFHINFTSQVIVFDQLS